MFACSETAPDSIEHYANCTALYAAVEVELGLSRQPSPEARLSDFLGLNFRVSDDPTEAVLRVLRLAAVFKVRCLCRHGGIRHGPAAMEAIRQACRELARRHRRAAQVYDEGRHWHRP